MPYGILNLVKTAAAGWWSDRAMSLGASISFFTVFSLAPMLLAAISVAGLLFGRQAAQGAVVAELGGLAGDDAAQAIDAMIANVSDFGTGGIGSAFGRELPTLRSRRCSCDGRPREDDVRGPGDRLEAGVHVDRRPRG